ncbi:MAG: hypothetical protein WCR47_08150 [Desulfoplanes sp.]
MAIDDLGKSMTADEVARELGVGRDMIRANSAIFGGVRISSHKTVFFEKLIVKRMEELNAAQAQEQERQRGMVWTDQAAVREAQGTEILDEAGSYGVGTDQQADDRPPGESRHGLW